MIDFVFWKDILANLVAMDICLLSAALAQCGISSGFSANWSFLAQLRVKTEQLWAALRKKA